MLKNKKDRRDSSEGTYAHGLNFLPTGSGSFKSQCRQALAETKPYTGQCVAWKEPPENLEEWMTYDYPFENLAFSAGGTRAIAYLGCLSVSPL